MFTGIVDHCGVITSVEQFDHSIRLAIRTQFSDCVLGESICVDGVCLTVTDFNDTTFFCDISSETRQLTISKKYSVGSQVNLERSMRLSDRLCGHIVTGHVEGVLKILALEKEKEFMRCLFSGIEKSHHLLLVKKGSVCINGVSLTINDVRHDCFSVMLIPHTLEKTNLHQFHVNDFVNVEYDYLAKLVQNNTRGFYEQA